MNRRLRTPTACDNMNHRRPGAPVAYCPQCGEVVNESLRSPSCSEHEHAAARRRQTEYCVSCGMQLIVHR